MRSEAILVLAVFAGCTTSRLELDAPDGFLTMRSRDDELRLTTAQQARLWVREFADPDGGTVDFWATALQNDLVERRGYELVQSGTINDARGNEGRTANYRTTVDGEPHGYLTAVWVATGGDVHTIRIAEYVAPAAEFEGRLEEVLGALRTLRP